MASVYPSLENIKRLRVLPTEGELFLAEYLTEALGNKFEIYFNPFLDGDRPDLIILQQGVGAFVVEVKDWSLEFYRIDGNNTWHVDDTKGNTSIIKSPMAQAFTYKKNLYDLHLPVLGLEEIKNPNFFNVVHCFVYFHGPSDNALKNLFKQAENETASEIAAMNSSYLRSNKTQIEHDAYEKRRSFFASKMQQITRDRAMSYTRESVGRLVKKISQTSTHVLFDDRVYDDFVRRLRPPEHVNKQGMLPKLDKKQLKIAESRQIYEKVKGVAGCGKTTILAARATNACKRHDGIALILTFNITLKNLIKDKLSAIQGYRNNPQIHVSNYHQFFNAQVNDVGLSLSDLVERYDLEKLYDIDVFRGKNTIKYKTILLDEVQDYKPEWVKIIRDNFLDEDAEMVLFGDQAQNIYGRQEGRESVIAQGFGRWNKLTKNYRASEDSPLNQLFKDFQIRFLVQKYADTEIIEVKPTQLGLGISSGEIKYCKFRDLEQLKDAFEFINKFIRLYSINPNDVVILGTSITDLRFLSDMFSGKEEVHCMYETYQEIASLPTQRLNKALGKARKCASCMQINNDAMQLIEQVRALCRNCVRPLEKELSEDLDKIRRRKKSHFYMNSGLLKFSTTHSFKGLEAKVAFYLLTLDDDPELVYTTMTRSVEHLVVIDLSQRNDFKDFFEANMKLAG